MIEVHPEGGKIARAHAVAPQVESGNVYLPHPAIAPWVETFIEEAASFPHGRHDDQVDAMTQALNRLRSNKGIFSVPDSQIIVNPFDTSAAWPRAFALVVTPTAVAALWGARDPGGTIFLYAEHLLPHPEPCQNARAIQALGGWIPGFLHINGSQEDKRRIARLYRDLGLNIETATLGEDAGVYQLLQLLAANKLKVFASLSGFLAEYRMGDEQSPLLLCCQSLILSRERMRTKPVPIPRPPQRVHSGDRSWMR